ncbi:MAG: 1-phosphofructokinase family hexose kinase [Spongiibacteraceae bacterium]
MSFSSAISSSPPISASIATLTLNPAVDATYDVDKLIPDQKAHAHAVRYDPGGNGINVGRALKILGAQAHNFCVTAGEIGQLFQRLVTPQLDHFHAEQIAGETRINITLLEQKTAAQYEVSAVGPALSAKHLENITARFIEQCTVSAGKQGIGVVTGSVPPGVDVTAYGELTRRIRERGGRAIVDTYGELLKHTIPAAPFLIKPNRYELEQYCGRELPTLSDVAREARRVQRDGIEYVAVSLGKEGALLCGPDNTYCAAAPAVKIISTVGAGDSMVAGLAFAFAQGQSAEQALRLGIACGSGTASHPGTELFTRADIETLSAHINVRCLDC